MDQTLYNKRHSLAHVLAAAVLKYYPEAKMTVGPATETGFYYDIDFGNISLKEENLAEIEAEMKRLVSLNLPFTGREVSTEEAMATFKDNPYKSELISDISGKGEKITIYATGDVFVDLCRGGHVDNTSEIDPESFKLEKIAGAYWKADAANKMLTRVYGLAFNSKEELEKYIWQQEEAAKRDHRKLGRELKIYTISDLVGSGLPLFHKNGQVLRRELTEYLWDLHRPYDYQWVWTPHLAKEALYETSGHAGSYMEDMFSVWGGTSQEKFFVKPMNCPHHMQLFADNQFSYRDMPQRYFEPATVYRDEKTGQLNGLARVRSITQDDGHIFCRVSQIQQEVKIMIDIINKFYATMGMEKGYRVRLSLRDDRENVWLGSDEVWEKAESALKEICASENLPYFEGPGEAAFYGPKLDFIFNDAIGREWQLATVQCDFNQPIRFGLSFINEKGEKEQPVVIHRAISGSIERFLGVAIEHFAGAFPTWLSPVQVSIVPVNIEKHATKATEIFIKMRDAGFRVEVDAGKDSLGKRIHAAKSMKTPYVIILGDKELESGNLTVETRAEKLENISVEGFLTRLSAEVKNRTLN